MLQSGEDRARKARESAWADIGTRTQGQVRFLNTLRGTLRSQFIDRG